MANIQRVRVEWTGFPGAPGVTTLYCTNAASALPEIKGLFADFLAFMPGDVTVAYPTTGDIIDPLNGDLVGAWTAAARAGDSGVYTGGYAAPVGFVIQWETGSIFDGHRLRGRTFMVPGAGNAFQNDGSIEGSVLAALNASIATHLGVLAGNLVVWHRPVEDRITHVITRTGGYSAVSSGSVPDTAAVLRSRRD